jgi:hypothetical protein
MSKPLDYSKWDNIVDSSDDEAPQPRSRAPAKQGASSAAATPGAGDALGFDAPETCDFSEAELLSMQEYEVERPERLNQMLKRALDILEKDFDAPSLDALASSESVPLFTTVRSLCFRLSSATRVWPLRSAGRPALCESAHR